MNRQALQERTLRIPDRGFDILHTPALFRRISHVVVYAELVKVIIESAAEVGRCVVRSPRGWLTCMSSSRFLTEAHSSEALDS
jgi:hypothetical protein